MLIDIDAVDPVGATVTEDITEDQNPGNTIAEDPTLNIALMIDALVEMTDQKVTSIIELESGGDASKKNSADPPLPTRQELAS